MTRTHARRLSNVVVTTQIQNLQEYSFTMWSISHVGTCTFHDLLLAFMSPLEIVLTMEVGDHQREDFRYGTAREASSVR
jgi:hypothetical protein